MQEQIVAKLRARVKRLTAPEARALKEALGRPLEAFADWARAAAPDEVAPALEAAPQALRFLDGKPGDRPRDPLYVYGGEDTLERIEDVLSGSAGPGNSITGFVRFVSERGNALPGLIAATRKPRELTRRELKESTASKATISASARRSRAPATCARPT